tara:strand:+ start:2359 stop:2637 length:279 start_codon:yes stop_codon:yes gene_type:complete
MMSVKLKVVKNSGYKLNDPVLVRRRALVKAIHYEANKKKISLKDAAIKKKARLNVLRIYRKFKYKKDCKKITDDMMFITKTFLNIGMVKKIC